MKKNANKYTHVDKLPRNAQTVKNFADNYKDGVSTSYIYKLVKEGKADFDIIVFQTVNFVTRKAN